MLLFFFKIEGASLNNKKTNPNSLLSKSTLKCLAYWQVFCVEVGRLYNKCIWALVFITNFQ